MICASDTVTTVSYTHLEGGDLGDAGYADRAVDDHLAAVAQLEILVDQAEICLLYTSRCV